MKKFFAESNEPKIENNGNNFRLIYAWCEISLTIGVLKFS